jgi:hypothetical protein
MEQILQQMLCPMPCLPEILVIKSSYVLPKTSSMSKSASRTIFLYINSTLCVLPHREVHFLWVYKSGKHVEFDAEVTPSRHRPNISIH